MPSATNVVDNTGDLSNWDQNTFQDGELAKWDAAQQKFVGVAIVAVTGDLKYTHRQLSPATSWTITHNLNKMPAVTVVDSAGTKVHGEVQYINENSLVVSFSSGFAGTAYLN